VRKLQSMAFIAAVLRLQSVGLALDRKPINIATVTDAAQPSSADVMKLFRQKVAEAVGASTHVNLFKVVNRDDASVSLTFQADCMPRQGQSDPYVCFYTLHYAGTNSKSFMGGGINATKTATEMADGFLASVAQDIVENMNNAVRSTAIESLEACLFLTQSSCAVPDALVSELKVKTLNLSQYLQKGGLNKNKPGPVRPK
jgi:hypothetical protein